MQSAVSCSRCGGSRDLHFVTCGEPGGDFPGRALVYCSDCRKGMHHMIDVSLPLSQLTPEIFLNLYRLGKTESNPESAIKIAFGKDNEHLAHAVEAILRSKRA
jgi:hypothetical protein